MADPLSISAGVIGVATAFLQVSKGLSDFVTTVKNAPQDISTIGDDIRAFGRTVSSLKNTLQRPDVRLLVDRDESLKDPMKDIEEGLGNCRKRLEALELALKGCVHKDDEGDNMKFKDVRWFYKKKGVQDLVGQFGQTKTTLNSHLAHATLAILLLSRPSNIDTDVSSALDTYSRIVRSDTSQLTLYTHSTLEKRAHEIEDMAVGFREAVSQNDEKTVKAFLDNNYDIDAKDREGRNNLLWATEAGNIAAVKLLLINGAEVDSLSYWSHRIYRPIVKEDDHRYPVGRFQKKPHAPGRTGALHAASLKVHLGIAELLLRYGANASMGDGGGRTPLHYASWSGSTEIAKLLLLHNAKASIPDENWQTPLHFAIESPYFDGLRMVEVLVKSGADVTATNSFGETPLHLAVTYGSDEMVSALIKGALDSGVPIEAYVNFAKGDEGLTALHYAAEDGFSSTIRLLVDSGAKLDAIAHRHGWMQVTPLHLAAWNGCTEAAKTLVQYAVSSSGTRVFTLPALMFPSFGKRGTAANMAELRGHTNIAAMIMKGAKSIGIEPIDSFIVRKIESKDEETDRMAEEESGQDHGEREDDEKADHELE